MDEIYKILYDPYSSRGLYDLAMLYMFSMNSPVHKPRAKNNKCMEVTKMDVLIKKYGALFSRAYRMDVDDFYSLHDLLKDDLEDSFYGSKRVKQSNFFIPTTIRLSIALRFFAGGDPLDIMINHGVCKPSVYRSVWGVVDCINS